MLHKLTHSAKFIMGLSLFVFAMTYNNGPSSFAMADGDGDKSGEYCKHPKGHDKSKCKKKHRGDGDHKGHGMMFEELNLDKDQQASVDRLKSECKKSAISLKSDIDILDIELKDMMNSDRTDLKKVKKKIAEIESKKADLKYLHAEKMVKIKALLNDEQKEKFKAMKKDKSRYGDYDKKKCSKKK